MSKDYDEIRLRYWGVGDARYFVLANGAESASAVIRLSSDARRYHDDLNLLLSDDSRGREPQGQKLRKLGEDITAELLPNVIQRCIWKCMDTARRQGLGLRLRFEMPPDLSRLPVELLRAHGKFLAMSQDISIVRAVPAAALPTDQAPAPRENVLTVLLVGASPRTLPAIEIPAEFARIEAALPKGVSRKILLNATRDKIGGVLRDVKGNFVVVISAHGKYELDAEEGYVVLEDDNGNPDLVSEELLAGLLVRRKLQLVVLNLCRGGKSDNHDPFSGVAKRLSAHGVPMVAAFQTKVTDWAACQFSPELFRALARGSWLDEACWYARIRIGDLPSTSIEWCTPTLYIDQHHYCTQLIRKQRRKAPIEKAWNSDRRNDAMARLRRDPVCAELLDKYREASVEVDLVPAISGICEDLNVNRSVKQALSRINALPFIAETDSFHLLQPLNQLAGHDSVGEDALLKRLLARVKTEAGWFLLHGEPGTGKSRLVALAREALLGEGYVVLWVKCASLTPAKILTALSKATSKALFQLRDRIAAKQIEALKQQWMKDKAVIILEDVSTEEIANLLPEAPASVICTSSKVRMDFISCDRSFELTTLTPQQADLLLVRATTQSKYHRNAAAFREAWRQLADSVDGSPEILAAASKIFDSPATDGEILAEILNFDTTLAQDRWKRAIESLPRDAKHLLLGFAVCADGGASLEFVGEIANIRDKLRLQRLRDLLVHNHLLRCVAIQRQYFRLNSLLRATLERSEGWQEASKRHLLVLLSSIGTIGVGRPDCLGEILVAARRHHDEIQNVGPILIGKGIDQLVQCALEYTVDETAESRRHVPDGKTWISRHGLVRGKLFRMTGRLLQARRYHKPYSNRAKIVSPETDAALSPKSSGQFSETWHANLQSPLHFETSDRMLKKQMKNSWIEKDWSRFSDSCEIRAWVLERLGHENRSKRLLEFCETKMISERANERFPEDGAQPSWVWWSLSSDWTTDSQYELLRNWTSQYAHHQPFELGSEQFGTNQHDDGPLEDSFITTEKKRMTEETKEELALQALALLAQEERSSQLPKDVCACYSCCIAVLQFCDRDIEVSEVLRRQLPICLKTGSFNLLSECYENFGMTLLRLAEQSGDPRRTKQAENMLALSRIVGMIQQFEESLAYACWLIGVIEVLASRNSCAVEYLDEAYSRIHANSQNEDLSSLSDDISRLRGDLEIEPKSGYARSSSAGAV